MPITQDIRLVDCDHLKVITLFCDVHLYTYKYAYVRYISSRTCQTPVEASLWINRLHQVLFRAVKQELFVDVLTQRRLVDDDAKVRLCATWRAFVQHPLLHPTATQIRYDEAIYSSFTSCCTTCLTRLSAGSTWRSHSRVQCFERVWCFGFVCYSSFRWSDAVTPCTRHMTASTADEQKLWRHRATRKTAIKLIISNM